MCSNHIGPESEESGALYSPNERFSVTADTFEGIWGVYNNILQREKLPRYIGERQLRSSLGVLGMRLVTATTVLDLADNQNSVPKKRRLLPEEKPLTTLNVLIGRPVIKGEDIGIVETIAHMPIGIIAYSVESPRFRVVFPFLRFDLEVHVTDANYHLFFPTRDEILELQRAFASLSPEYILGVYSMITAVRTERWREVLYFFWRVQEKALEKQGITGGILGQMRRCKREQEECPEMQWFKERLFAAERGLTRLALLDLTDPWDAGHGRDSPPSPIAI